MNTDAHTSFAVFDQTVHQLIVQDPVAALEAIGAAKSAITELEREAVFAALPNHTWKTIGDALGVTKQAVFQRFGPSWVTAKKAEFGKQHTKEWKAEVRRALRDQS